jgi:glycosyltransferase involved in cell wall biosynthesis
MQPSARLGVNLIGLTSSRLSGVGQYSVKLFETMLDLVTEQSINLSVVGFVMPEARSHFSDHAQRQLVDVSPGFGRVRRVIFDHTRFPLIIHRARLDVLMNPAFTGPLWGAKRHVPVIHDLYFRVVPELLESRQQKYLAAVVPVNLMLAWRVITDSRSSATDIGRYYPFAVDRTRVVHLAGRFGSVVSSPSMSTRGTPPYALMVSSMTANKDPATAIAAVAHMRAQGHDFHLKHIGADPTSVWANAVGKANSSDFCHALGPIDDARMLTEMAGATCLVVPSVYEGFGLPVLEGQQLGAPVVCSNASSLPEVGGEGALYFNAGDATGCANHMTRLLVDPVYRCTVIEKGHANAARFTWRETAMQTLRNLDLM